MGLGVLEPKSGEKVPGTVHVERLTREQRELTANLKHGTGKDEHIVLVPQPSDSPNDPLSKCCNRCSITAQAKTIQTGRDEQSYFTAGFWRLAPA